MLTEKEAATKWCPFARAVLYPNGKSLKGSDAHNRAAFLGDETCSDEELNPQFCRCIGSHCMAWEWITPAEVRASGVNGLGHCGLAGKL